MRRIRWVDDLRGVAIVLMVIFHFCYDLRYFGYVEWDVPNGPHWWPFRYLILTLFIFTMGVSLSLAHGQNIRWRKFAIRLAQLIFAAAAITLMSLYMFPSGWIYFGILHFLALASVVGLIFVPVPVLAFGAGLLILLLYWSGSIHSQWPFAGMDWIPAGTEDYVSLFPWLGVTLLGVATGTIASQLKLDRFFHWMPAAVGLAGCHGLVIYLVHQPILFGGFYLASLIFK